MEDIKQGEVFTDGSRYYLKIHNPDSEKLVTVCLATGNLIDFRPNSIRTVDCELKILKVE